MKKLIILAILIVAIAATPWFVGLQAQKEIQSQVELYANYPGYTVELTEYNRGLLSSSGKLKIAYDFAHAPQNDDAEEKVFAQLKEGIVLNLNITHGPLLGKPGFGPGLSYTEITLDDSQQFVRDTEALFGVEELITVNTKLDFNGDGTGKITAPLLAAEKDGVNFKFGGMNVDFELEDFGRKQKSSGTVEPISFNLDNNKVDLSTITFQGEGEKSDSLFGTGKFSLNLPSIKLTGQKNASIENLVVAVDVGQSNPDMLDINYEVSMDNVSGSELPYELSDGVLNFTFKNVKESALEKLTKLSAQADMSTPEAASTQQQKINAVMSELMSASPEIIVNDFAFKLADDIWMNLKGSLSLDGAIAGKPEIRGNPQLLVPAITANYTANLSEGLIRMGMQQYLSQQFSNSGMSEEEIAKTMASQAEQTTNMIELFTGMGYLQKVENAYRIETSFNRGEFKVNGKALPLPI